jgi:hypothetical protein
LVKYFPCSSVTRTQCALHRLCRQTVFRSCHMPSSLEPRRKWDTSLLKDRTASNRCLMTAGRANQPPSSLSPWLCAKITCGAYKPIRPA